jgi:SNF family Na+-dependent transporter
MLFLAAITSSVSMLQPIIAFFEEGFGLKRHASVAILGLLSALGTFFVLYFSQGLTALDTFDFWVGTFLIYVVAMFQAILYGWVLGIGRGEEEAHMGAHVRIPKLVQYLLKYVTPVYLIVIFGAFCYSNMPGYLKSISENRVAGYSLGFLIAVIGFLILMINIAGKRWDAQGRFNDQKIEE